MQCPRCQHENPAGQKFCGGCGTRLASVCPSCSASNPPGQKFCGECGTALGQADGPGKYGTPDSYTPKHLAEKILTSKAALEGERKQVTVLFADLKGSMELLADRDPEEARKLLDPVLELMMEAVHRYEGTVNQVMGDGIMALFSAPLAHEDHAVRACYAALRMQQRLAGPTQHAFTVGEAYNTVGVLYLRKGDWAMARSLIEHSIAAFRKGNIVIVLPVMLAYSAIILAQAGELSEAVTRFRECEQLLEHLAAQAVVFTPYGSLGRAALLLGRLDEAQSLGERVIEWSPSRRGIIAYAQHLLGDIATCPDRFDAERGEAHYREALALAEPRGMRPLIAHCHFGLGKLYRRTGQHELASEHLTTATTMYREMGMTYWLEQAEAEMRALAG
jgi:hypothetical protein